MYDDPLDSVTFSGAALKRRVLNTVSDTAVQAFAQRNPTRYATPGAEHRPNMFRARREAVNSALATCSVSDVWVREIVSEWSRISGISTAQADFWRDAGFMDAVRNGRDIQVRRYLDDDGWGWVVIRDIPNHWLQKRRLPETTRQVLAARARRREADRKRF